MPCELKIQFSLLKFFGLLWIMFSDGKRAGRASSPSDSFRHRVSLQAAWGQIYLAFKSQQFSQAQRLPRLLQGKSAGQMCLS